MNDDELKLLSEAMRDTHKQYYNIVSMGGVNEAMKSRFIQEQLAEEPKPKVPFLKCVVHETKSVYLKYLLVICTIIDLLVALGINTAILEQVVVIGNAIGPFLHPPDIFSAIANGISFIVVSILVFFINLPWWVWGLIIVIGAPFVYVLYVCCERRNPDVAGVAVVIVFLAVLFSMICIGNSIAV